MRILHIVPGLEERGNGIAVAAKLIAAEQGADLIAARLFARGEGGLDGYDEVWVHSCWLPMTLRSCWRVLRAGKPLVRMTHANLDPVRLRYHGWKKRLVGPIERWCLRRCDRIVATCEAEKGWIEMYLGKHCPPIEATDIKRFFNLQNSEAGALPRDRPLHLLYLGRKHPLKGLEYLEAAVAALNEELRMKNEECPAIELKVVSNAFGEEKEKVWDWCDVLVLPTLSDNFGLVIAEALERGKRVITTDGAPAWKGGNNYGGRLVFLEGYRDLMPDERLSILKDAIMGLG